MWSIRRAKNSNLLELRPWDRPFDGDGMMPARSRLLAYSRTGARRLLPAGAVFMASRDGTEWWRA